jgi:energy-coupling factor transporter ATP-binding protein EcfA2
MKISLLAPYKSLRPFESDELNDFTIITGKNGSGKSQLLKHFDPEVIKQQQQQQINTTGSMGEPNIQIRSPQHIYSIQAEGIQKDGSIQLNYDHWKKFISPIIERYRKLTPSIITIINILSQEGISSNEAYNLSTLLLPENTELQTAINNIISTIINSDLKKDPLVKQKTAFSIAFNSDSIKIYNLAKEISEYNHKPIDKLSDYDFYNSTIEEHHIDNTSLFGSIIEYVFYNYAKRRDANRKNFFYKKEDNIENNSIPNDEFEKQFIPPWQIINSILHDNNLDFHFQGIDKREFDTDTVINLTLIKTSTNEIIPLTDLSSGEKVILGLIIKIFTSQYYGTNLSFPQLILLDEPDAHLHPEMSKLLLDVLSETFVKKLGIKVIITTHSPSTIALADENCIYQLINGINTSLKKVSKDAALKLLTGFIPTLSIDYKNHRQVFAESPTDVSYYQRLYEKHAQKSELPHRLYFISNAMGDGNCDLVYRVVGQLRDAGNNTSYGIVDWDLKNNPTEFVHVHGINERYNIESFLLDPIYVICLLIDNGNAHNIMGAIGIGEDYNQYLLGEENSDRIQSIIINYFSLYEKRFPNDKYETERIAVQYLNGRNIEIPKWYLQTPRHDLVDKVKEVFPALKNKYKDEGMIQSALIKIMIKSYPFVPASSIELIEILGGKIV